MGFIGRMTTSHQESKVEFVGLFDIDRPNAVQSCGRSQIREARDGSERPVPSPPLVFRPVLHAITCVLHVLGCGGAREASRGGKHCGEATRLLNEV
jgi:hypothetical protein